MSEILIRNERGFSTKDSTLGLLSYDGEPIGFVIEDEYRTVKVKGETRIPSGKYKLKLRKDLTPLTKKYRDRFSWFTWHIELSEVPNFTDVYIHIGNSAADTEACQLIGTDASIKDGNFVNKYSTDMFEKFYKTVVPALEAGVLINYEVIDGDIRK